MKKLLICPLSYYFVHSRSKYLLQHPILKRTQLTFLPQGERPVSLNKKQEKKTKLFLFRVKHINFYTLPGFWTFLCVQLNSTAIRSGLAKASSFGKNKFLNQVFFFIVQINFIVTDLRHRNKKLHKLFPYILIF